jgi:flagellar protein FliO/FliZ
MITASKTKYLMCILFLFLCIACVQAQDAGKSSTAAATDETSILLGQSAGTAAQPVNAPNPSSFWILVRIVLVLALVCAGIYGIVYLIKKSSGIPIGNDPYLKSVATLSLSPNKSVQVITIGEKGYVVGITEQNISLIAEVTDRELIDAMNLQAEKKSPLPKGSFQAVFSSFFPTKKPSETVGEQTASFGGTDFLRSQRERLQRSGQSESEPKDRQE